MILRAIKFITAAIIAAYSLSSCTAAHDFALTIFPPYDKTLNRVSRLTNAAQDKEVLLVPMCHLGTAEHYAKVREYLDSLKGEGYVTFCESVIARPYHIDTIGDITIPMLAQIAGKEPAESDAARNDTLFRKLRYALGFHLGENFNDLQNRSIPDVYRKRGYAEQSFKILGLSTDKDIWVDYTIADMLELYERQYGEIPLTTYDFATELTEPYSRENNVRINTYALISANRENFLRRRIEESCHKKIAVVYGESHAIMLKFDLQHLHGYEFDKKYKVPKNQR
ncbi:MAG: hypothetical protein K2J51_06935 [Alistipes sp.]|nr:hypothetical protein [Alistipes sp.]